MNLGDLNTQQEHELVTVLNTALKHIKRRPKPLSGICSAVHQYLEMRPFRTLYRFQAERCAQILMQTYWRYWPKFSGDTEFPVPDQNPDQSPRLAYWQDHRWVGPYGENRVELLNFLIECTENHLASIPK